MKVTQTRRKRKVQGKVKSGTQTEKKELKDRSKSNYLPTILRRTIVTMCTQI
jgi:hypothetical protein